MDHQVACKKQKLCGNGPDQGIEDDITTAYGSVATAQSMYSRQTVKSGGSLTQPTGSVSEKNKPKSKNFEAASLEKSVRNVST